MTLQDLADELHRAYQSAPQAERWQTAARAVLHKLNERPVCAAILNVQEDGEIVELVPPAEPFSDGLAEAIERNHG